MRVPELVRDKAWVCLPCLNSVPWATLVSSAAVTEEVRSKARDLHICSALKAFIPSREAGRLREEWGHTRGKGRMGQRDRQRHASLQGPVWLCLPLGGGFQDRWPRAARPSSFPHRDCIDSSDWALLQQKVLPRQEMGSCSQPARAKRYRPPSQGRVEPLQSRGCKRG